MICIAICVILGSLTIGLVVYFTFFHSSVVGMTPPPPPPPPPAAPLVLKLEGPGISMSGRGGITDLDDDDD
jgi:hypothetical protein